MYKKLTGMIMAIVIGAMALTGCGPDKKQADNSAAAQSEQAPIRTEQMNLKSGENNIYGTLYLPGEEKDKYPTVILCHGFNTNSDLLEGYCKSFAKAGYACYAFDFCGGALGSRSDGATTDMSVLTEAQNLMDVMDQLCELDYVDASNLFLMGQSQGGYVASYTAAQKADKVKGLILFFPAFALQDGCWERHGSIENVPDEEEVMGMKIGGIYSKDAMSIDIYEEIGKYTGDVLICHGDKDEVVSLAYSEKAVEVYNSAELKVIQYGTHGFQGKTAKEATQYSLEYLNAHVE